jgi:hypothetical protein
LGWVAYIFGASDMRRRVLGGIAIIFLVLIYLGDIGTHRGWFPPKEKAPSSIQTETNASSSHAATAPIIIALPLSAPITARTPRQITVQQALQSIVQFRQIQGTCPLIVTAPTENDDLKDTLVALFGFPNQVTAVGTGGTGPFSYMRGSTSFMGFNVLALPIPIPDADSIATPSITVPRHGEIVVHAPSNVANADVVAELLREMGLKVVSGFQYPHDSPKDTTGLVYVEIGTGSVWR